MVNSNSKGDRRERELINNLYDDPEWLHERYVSDRWSTYRMADHCDVSDSTIRKYMNRYGIERRGRGGQMKQSARFYTKHDGYERWDGHSYNCSGCEGRVYVHRLLAVAEYGFDAVVGRDVHHKNGVPWDNRPSNIEPLSEEDHARVHHAN